MTDMAELKKRKVPLNLAIVHVDPDAFIANFMGWLEITAFISAQHAGEAQVPAGGELTARSVRAVNDIYSPTQPALARYAARLRPVRACKGLSDCQTSPGFRLVRRCGRSAARWSDRTSCEPH